MTWSTFAEHWWLLTNTTAPLECLIINRTFGGFICPAHVTSRYRQQAPAEVWKTEFYFWSLGSLFSTVWGRKFIPGQAYYPQGFSSLWSSKLERLLIYFSSIKKKINLSEYYVFNYDGVSTAFVFKSPCAWYAQYAGH